LKAVDIQTGPLPSQQKTPEKATQHQEEKNKLKNYVVSYVSGEHHRHTKTGPPEG